MTTRTHRRAANIALAVVALCMVLAAHNALDGLSVAAIPTGVWWFLAGALVTARVSFRAGQYARGYAHARGIRRSHWNAIGGKH